MLLHHLIKFAAVTLVVLGIVSFSLLFWANSVIKDAADFEMPLSMVSDVAVAPDSRIYVGIMPYGRVQVYGADGRFLRSFSVDAPSGSLCLDAMDAPPMPIQDPRVHTAEWIIDGLRVREFWPSRQFECRFDPPVGSVSWWPTSVTVTFTDGRAPLALARAWWHYLALGPFWSVLMIAIGNLLQTKWP